MKNAKELIDLYKKQKNTPPSAANEVSKVIVELFETLGKFASKEMPVVNVEAPIIKQEVLPAEVKVELENPINVEIPKLDQPEIHINAQDYTKLLTSLKESVDKLVSIMDSRPKEWEVVRDNRGFIQKVKGHEA